MVVKRPLFPIVFFSFFFLQNTYDKFVVSYLVPLIIFISGSPTFVHIRVKRSLWATFVSSQGLKHAIHSRHKYWHEHAHHDTRHVVTQLEDTTWPSSDALKDDGEEKKGGAAGGGEEGAQKKERVWRVRLHRGWKLEEEKEKEVVVVVVAAVELRAQEGSFVRPCMFGSIQCVHVVNMKAGILYAQQTAGFSRGKCCF